MFKNKSLFLILSILTILIFSSVIIANNKIFKYSKISIEDRSLLSFEYITEKEFPLFIENIKTNLNKQIKDVNFSEISKINLEYLNSIKNDVLKYKEYLSFNKINNKDLNFIIIELESEIDKTNKILEEIAILKNKNDIDKYLDKLDNILVINKNIYNYMKNYTNEVNK